MSSLDPQVTAEALYESTAAKREQRIYDINHPEPPFPYKVIGLDPGTFGLDGLQVFIPTSREVKV